MLLTVKNPVANIYKKNNKKSEIVTQILYGENFITYSKSGKFYRGYKAYDKYKGFIESKDLHIDKIKKTHKIISRDCSLYKKPNNKYKILNHGSLNYQLSYQKYNTIPPRNLLPLENIINNKYLIKEKADGLLIFTLPTNIYPNIDEIINFEIKAEFIEDLNLYLIFDINIPNTTIIERQHYLRNIHYITKNISYTPLVNNFDTLIDEIQKERNLLKNFIETNNNEFKWYPKGSWEILMNDDIYFNLINVIENTNKYNEFILNGIFNCDGLILTPLNGLRELKIKPKHLQTIDLLYKNNMWIDSNNKEWNIEMITNKKYENKIYRCYPHKNKYIATEIRYDKKTPNSSKVIDQIININNYNWLSNINFQIYYDFVKNINDIQLIEMLNNQKNLLNININYMKPEINKNWLDLGCGKCKLYNTIKTNYMPKKYLGIDNDINILSKKYNLVDNNEEIIDLYPCDLSDKWDKNNIWNSFNWSIKYDYIIANFSIMHFWSNLFWEQLDKVTHSGSIFLFNITKVNMTWKYNNSYLVSDENITKIYFEWTHEKEHIEPIINDNLIDITFKKYNWVIHDKLNYSNNLSPNYNNLSQCYNWIIAIKL